MFWKRKSAKVTQVETVYLPKGAREVATGTVQPLFELVVTLKADWIAPDCS